jgi:hypothetical protein
VENNWEEAFAVEVALDQDAVTLLPVLDAAAVQLGARLRGVVGPRFET